MESLQPGSVDIMSNDQIGRLPSLMTTFDEAGPSTGDVVMTAASALLSQPATSSASLSSMASAEFQSLGVVGPTTSSAGRFRKRKLFSNSVTG